MTKAANTSASRDGVAVRPTTENRVLPLINKEPNKALHVFHSPRMSSVHVSHVQPSLIYGITKHKQNMSPRQRPRNASLTEFI